MRALQFKGMQSVGDVEHISSYTLTQASIQSAHNSSTSHPEDLHITHSHTKRRLEHMARFLSAPTDIRELYRQLQNITHPNASKLFVKYHYHAVGLILLSFFHFSKLLLRICLRTRQPRSSSHDGKY